MKFSFIDKERNNFTVDAMCRVLDVSRQGYYAWKSRPTSKHKLRDAELAEKIINLHTTHWGVYGAPRIHALLKREGVHTSRKRVARLMVENNLCGVSKRLKPKRNKQKPECDNADDLVK